MKTKPIVAGLALAALFFAVLLPPEAYPDGKLVVLLCSTFAFFVNLSERRIRPAYLYGGIAGFGYLILHALIFSVDSYRSLEMTSLLWAYYCLLGFFLYAGFDPLKPVAVCMVVLTLIVSAYGLYQYFWGFDQLYRYISYGGSDQIAKVPALQRIATRRVFSTLALPGTLWGFLVIALPFHAALWAEQWKKARIVRAGIAVSAAMLLATGFLTRSFGFLLGLLVLAGAWLVLKHRRIAWNRLTAILIVLVIAGGAFYSARRGVIEGANPLSLRFKNWISAWSVFAANPMGSGLNTYGVMYPRYMVPGANETQYAHNTPLQLVSELGFPVLLAAVVASLLAVRARQRGELRPVPIYLLLALAAWLLHNLIDINVYFGSVGVIGVVLVAIVLRTARGTEAPQGLYPTGPVVTSLVVGAGIAILGFAALVMVSSELQFRARAEFEENKLVAAAETLAQATYLMPINSSIVHDAGDVHLNLYHKKRDPKYLTAALESFQRAIALSPEKSGSHVGLALSLGSANQVSEARDEIRQAIRLYPTSTYVHSIARLFEQRSGGVAFK
jgi:hypothetical protein